VIPLGEATTKHVAAQGRFSTAVYTNSPLVGGRNPGLQHLIINSGRLLIPARTRPPGNDATSFPVVMGHRPAHGDESYGHPDPERSEGEGSLRIKLD
jgi:hypothetical protein